MRCLRLGFGPCDTTPRLKGDPRFVVQWDWAYTPGALPMIKEDKTSLSETIMAHTVRMLSPTTFGGGGYLDQKCQLLQWALRGLCADDETCIS